MIPTYNPLDFENLDLRKYHIKSLRDVQRFMEFMMSRLDEAQHVVKTVANENSTLHSVVKQMQKQQEKINAMYGAPAGNQPRDIPADSGTAVVQTVEDQTAQAERDALLDDIRQAVANDEEHDEIPKIVDQADDPTSFEYENYKLVVGTYSNGNKRLFWYRDAERKDGGVFKKMVSEKDVPEDIKQHMKEVLGEA